MSAFSPVPTPRRTTRLRPPPTSPPPRTKVGTGSRFATPVRTTPFGHDNASIASGMDIDEGNSVTSDRGVSMARARIETVYARSDELVVSFYASLPVEVKQILKNSDFYRDSYTGDIDTLTGFALVASAQTCFVWQHAQAVKGIPTCYIFSCPQSYQRPSPPFHGLVPYGSSREPGLILISAAGEIRFWDSIGIGLAGGENYATTDLGLSSDELVTNLVRSDAQTFIASTTSGLLFRLTLTSAGGNHRLTSHPFSRPSSSLSLARLLPSFFASSSNRPSSNISTEPGNINSVALGATNSTGGRDLWALVDTRVQRWDMKAEGWEEVLLDEEVAGIIRFAVRDAFGEGVEQDNARMDLELLDIAIDDDQMLVVLISYAGHDEEASSMAMDLTGVRRIYALIRLSDLGDSFQVDSVRSVPYQSTSTSGAPMHPRIQLILGGQMISIQFGDAVALCARDLDYRDRLELKSATDGTLGVGVVQSESTLLVLTAATMMKVHINMDRVLTYNAATGRTHLIKTIMTQAILYGSLPENPLQFSFPPEVDEESLMQGAEQLSQAVLESDSQVVQRNHDLSAQLTGRKERLSWLIRFINDNAVLVKMSQRSRQKLATDAEKLYACHQLWIQHNDLLATSPTHSVLNDAVYSYMDSLQEGHYDDLMRAFFRLKVGDIGELISQIGDVTAVAAQDTGLSLVELLPDANRIVLTVLKSAFDYREYNLGVYGIELPMIEPWTSEPRIIDLVLGLFESTSRVVDSAEPGTAATRKDMAPNAQLPDLAGVLFACIQERLDWLSSVAGSDSIAERDGDELSQKFTQLRPDVLETLRRNGHTESAFSLAEKYHDFSSLAALCHRDTVYPPHQNPHALRIQAYVERYKTDFTTELYRWYIQHGELRIMFSQEDAHSGYMDKFFAANPYPTISWIHDLEKGRHGSAASTLLAESRQATNLGAKHLMLSIGKLSHLAQLQETETAATDTSVLNAFHDDLDFVSVHETLLQEFRSSLQSLRGRQSLEAQLDAIVKDQGSSLSDRTALSQVFRDLIRELLQGKALSIEDAVDVLTLKDNVTTVEDYATALHLLARAEDVPQTRKMSAFRTVWRRIYIHDDWDAIRRTANVSDVELNERFQNTALYSTLCAILPRDYQPEGYDTSPDVALSIPTTTEIASRWPGMTPEQVEALGEDYNLECDRLGEMDLDDVYHRVRELAVHHVSEL